MTLAMAAVCEHMRMAIGAMSVVFFTLGGGRYIVGNLDRVRRTIGSSGPEMDSGGTSMTGVFGMDTLGGAYGGWSSCGWHMGRSIELCRLRVCGNVVRCGFGRAGSVILAQRWMAWWSAFIEKN